MLLQSEVQKKKAENQRRKRLRQREAKEQKELRSGAENVDKDEHFIISKFNRPPLEVGELPGEPTTYSTYVANNVGAEDEIRGEEIRGE